MKRMFKQWWSIIGLTLINRTPPLISNDSTQTTGTTWGVEDNILAWTCTNSGGVWLFNGVVAFHFDNWISNENTDVSKQLDISIDLRPLIKDAHTKWITTYQKSTLQKQGQWMLVVKHQIGYAERECSTIVIYVKILKKNQLLSLRSFQ